jgi:hypothetical protein
MIKIYGVTSSDSSASNQGLILTGITQGSGTIVLTKNGNAIEDRLNSLIIRSNAAYACQITIVASTDTNPKYSARWNMNALVHRYVNESSVRIVGVSMVDAMSDVELSALQVRLSENTTYGSLSIQCTGIVQYTVINWIATIVLTEV